MNFWQIVANEQLFYSSSPFCALFFLLHRSVQHSVLSSPIWTTFWDSLDLLSFVVSYASMIISLSWFHGMTGAYCFCSLGSCQHFTSVFIPLLRDLRSVYLVWNLHRVFARNHSSVSFVQIWHRWYSLLLCCILWHYPAQRQSYRETMKLIAILRWASGRSWSQSGETTLGSQRLDYWIGSFYHSVRKLYPMEILFDLHPYLCTS